MPLIDCPDCTNPVSDRASFCPTCGCPSKYFPRTEIEKPKPPAPPPLVPVYGPFALLGRVVLTLTIVAVGIDLISLGVGDADFRFRGVGVVASAQILVFTLLHYRWWASLPAGHRRTTPEKAVAGCLIPLFNLVWLRTSWFGLIEDLNIFLTAQGTPKHAASTMTTQIHVALYYMLAPLVALLPYFGVSPPYWAHIVCDIAAVISLYGIIQEANRAAAYVRGHRANGG
jgi:hypothetical protein